MIHYNITELSSTSHNTKCAQLKLGYSLRKSWHILIHMVRVEWVIKKIISQDNVLDELDDESPKMIFSTNMNMKNKLTCVCPWNVY
jgi:hypothetical protein